MADAPLDTTALTRYFRQHIPGFEGPLRVELIHGGRSNLTYLVSDCGSRWVLRRPPFGLVAPTANDLGREFRVVAALGPTPVPVARAMAFCDDSSVIGAPFSVVSMVEGRVIRSAADGAALSAEDADRLTTALVTGLAAIHAIPYQDVGLGDLGRPVGYLERQVNLWRRQWEMVATRTLPGIAELHAKLAAAMPEESGATIVHGDYRLDNTIIDPGDNGVLAAIVDWEMATLGDPLADLGLLLVYWDPVTDPIMADGHAIGANPGFPPAMEVARRYAGVSGRPIDNLEFYLALGYFKLAVIAESIHNRFLADLTVGDGFDTVGAAVAPLVEAGLRVLAP
ncbi:MAG: phosphotransferase family protein [Acidimicrobiaceae bacterium]|nr:phosphotransferase family protein [Acidimicrobiaceae bacterium]MBO0746931.1 phosphotransferase family protein [Acidimicrobiaceae bacterium]